MTVEQLKQHAEKNKKRGLREMKPGQLTLIRLPLKVGDSKKIYSELAPRGAKNRVFTLVTSHCPQKTQCNPSKTRG